MEMIREVLLEHTTSWPHWAEVRCLPPWPCWAEVQALPDHVKDAAQVIVSYDVTDRVSFLNTAKWIEDVWSASGPDVVIALVGINAGAPT